MKEIQLTQGKVAIVSNADYKIFNKFKWQAHRDQKNGMWYAARNVNQGNKLYLHRAILNAPKGSIVDHCDGNGLHDWRRNLRFATTSQNAANRKKPSTNTSGYKGVHWHKATKKWAVRIRSKGKEYSAGYFTDVIDAAHAYDAIAQNIFGSFARLNFPATKK